MKLKIDPGQGVGEIAVILKESIPVFEKYGIDYYCDGGRTLKDACYYVGVPLEEVATALEKLEIPEAGWYVREPDWQKEPMAKLIEYILQTHHAFARAQIKRISNLVGEAASRIEGPPAELAAIQGLFQGMADEMENHMRHEEEVVFPYLLEVERSLANHLPLPKTFEKFDYLHHPLHILAWEHGMTEKEWKEIGRLTGNFKAADSRREGLQQLFDALLRLEKDNRNHVHLENNILLKKAAQLGLLD
jgi:regulator of cell morphogenesis and NO signaling